MTDSEKIESLRGLREKAAQGEWTAVTRKDRNKLLGVALYAVSSGQFREFTYLNRGQEETAIYIAALHNANLIDKVEELEAENERLKSETLEEKAMVMASKNGFL